MSTRGPSTPQDSQSSPSAAAFARDSLTRLDEEPDAQASSDPLPKVKALQRYVVLGELGAGGMGVVYDAYDPVMSRRVAIKVILQNASGDGSGSTQASDRFIAEARALAKLSHPNIVAIYDVGVADQQVYFVMEMVEGGTLTQWLKREKKPRSWRDIVEIMIAAGEGLAAVHAAGLVHRDFKPDNVLVGNDGRARIADFGLVGVARTGTLTKALAGTSTTALARGPDHSLSITDASARFDNGLTKLGDVMGTPKYMSPEQHRGAFVDARSDQFSFCVALFITLYGVAPFPGADAGQIAKSCCDGIIHWPATLASRRVPTWLRRIIVRGLALQPGDRFGDMHELVAALRRGLIRRKVHAAWATTLTVAALGLAVVVNAPWSAQSAALNRCRQGSDKWLGVWDSVREQQLAQRLVDPDKAPTLEVWRRVASNLDTYKSQWLTDYERICLTGNQKNAVLQDFDLQMGCLYRALSHVSGLVSAWSNKGPEVLQLAVVASLNAPDLARCENLDDLRTAVPLPADEDQRREVEDMRRDLAQINGTFDAGDFQSAMSQTVSLLHRSQVLQDPALLADIHSMLGALKWRFADAKMGIFHHTQGLVYARSCGHWEAAAQAATELAFHRGFLGQEYSVAHELLSEAKALLQAANDPPIIVANWYNYAGIIAGIKKDREASAEFFSRAVHAAKQANGPKHMQVAVMLGNLAIAEIDRDHLAMAEQLLRQKIDMVSELMGPEHPELIFTLINFSRTLTNLGRYAEARDHTQRSLEMCTLHYAEDALACTSPRSALVRDLIELGEYRASLAQLELVRAVQEKHGRRGHPSELWWHTWAAKVYLRMGQVDRAKELARRGLDQTRKEPEGTPTSRANAWLLLAEVAWSQGAIDEARANLEQARPHLEWEAPGAMVFEGMSQATVELLEIRVARATHNYDRAFEVLAQVLDRQNRRSVVDDPNQAIYLLELAMTLRENNEASQAKPVIERALALVESAHGREHHLLVPYLSELGLCQLELLQSEQALATFERAILLFDGNEVEPNQLAPLHFGLARVHWQLGHVAQARYLAATALEEYANWDGGGVAQRHFVQQWLRLTHMTATQH